MAIRKIVTEGDDILRKHCREVSEVTDRIRETMQDMLERNSSGDASLLLRRNSIPEMTVKMHVAEE